MTIITEDALRHYIQHGVNLLGTAQTDYMKGRFDELASLAYFVDDHFQPLPDVVTCDVCQQQVSKFKVSRTYDENLNFTGIICYQCADKAIAYDNR